MITYDSVTTTSTGSFLVSELERLDQTLNMPLSAVTWSRDIQLRTDVTMGDEFSSYTNSNFASQGGLSATGKSWIGKNSNAVSGIDLDIAKTTSPLRTWGQVVGYSIIELEQAMRLGRPIDTQKIEGLNLKFQMDVDEQVYLGDTDLGLTGLFNNTGVTPANVAAGGGGVTWALKTPLEILKDVQEIERAAWAASGYAVAPTELRVAPAQMVQLLQPLTIGGTSFNSIAQYIALNSLCMQQNGKPLNIQSVKWLTTAGAGSTARMVAYTNEYKYARFPMVGLQRTPLSSIGLIQSVTYFSKLGQVELPYSETLAYRDGM